jgi:hypothetical protein
MACAGRPHLLLQFRSSLSRAWEFTENTPRRVVQYARASGGHTEDVHHGCYPILAVLASS